MPEPEPIGWRAVVYGTRVTTDDGSSIGTVHEMLGSDAEDIFHGVRVSLNGSHRDVMIPAGNVSVITSEEIRTDLLHAEIETLPAYDEVGNYHVAEVGRVRKHLGWAKDSTSDEEPG